MREFTDQDKIDNARMDLIMNFPFYGSVFLRLNVYEDPTCPTAWTDGVSMGYNVKFMASLDHEVIIGVFVHEVLHVVLKHHLREAECQDFKDNHKKWNYAADYSLNPIIKKSKGMNIDDTWLYKSQWDDSLADEIFYQLKDSDCQCGDGPGEVRPFPGEGKDSKAPTAAEIDAESQKVDQWIKGAQFKAQGVGKLPGHVNELVKMATAPTVCWQDELVFLCEEITKNNYTWTRPNQRYMQFGVYLPAMSGQKIVDMIFFVDTSGSLDDRQLEKICAEIHNIVSSFNVRVIIVYWDSGFREMEVFEPSDVLDPEWGLSVSGRGGTNFERCWLWLDENMPEFDFDPKAMVLFSDLECTSYPDNDPDMPMLWAQVPTHTGRFNDDYLEYLPSYGRHVRVPVYKEG